MLVLVAVTLLIVIVVMMLVLVLKLLDSRLERILVLHCGENILTVEIVPRGCYYNSVSIMRAKKLNALGNLEILGTLSVREDYRRCVSNLVVVELTEVLHIHLALINVRNGGKAVKHCTVLLRGLCRADNVRKLAYTRGLNDNSVGLVLVEHLCKCGSEIADERTANATRVHLRDLDACVCQKSAVNADLTELVFDKNNLFTCVCFLYKLFNKRSFSRAEKAGKNIYFRHFSNSPLQIANIFTIVL